jgi:hypothetical protein
MDDRQGEDEKDDNGNDDEEMEKRVYHTNLGLCPLAQTNTSFPVLHSH